MTQPFLSRFTPSLMSAEALEAIFVQRESLAQRLVDLIRESASGYSRQNTLLVGPRGIGKTHMVALVYHRLWEDEELGKQLVIAWLKEEEWGVASFLDLLLRILLALRGEYGSAGLEELESLYEFSPDEAEKRATDLLLRYLGDRTLLVLAENLDDIFAGLGSVGQRRLRAFLQEQGSVSLLATSQSLFNGVSLQTSPFYGFFRVHHLEELDLDDAVQLLARIATLAEKDDLAAFLQTPAGRARVRAVHHLAGGNPRVYVMFSQFLTVESLEQLVDPFMRLLDDLTPYYQSRMAWISPQQRKIVDFLLERRGGVAVKEIAKHCFLSPQGASSQLKDLRDSGYVRAINIGRESYYELREPLMRLCLEVKRHQGEPIRLFVEFLRMWYSRRELEDQLITAKADAVAYYEYIESALQEYERTEDDPRVLACLSDLNQLVERGAFEAALRVSDELLAIRGSAEDWSMRIINLFRVRSVEEGLASIEEALILFPGHDRLLIYKSIGLFVCVNPAIGLDFILEAIRSKPDSLILWAVLVELMILWIEEGRGEDKSWSAWRRIEKKPADLSSVLREIILAYKDRNSLGTLATMLFF